MSEHSAGGEDERPSSRLKNNLLEVFREIPVNLLKLALVGLALYILSLTPVGNWLRCNFLDTQGCLARFELETRIVEPVTFCKADKFDLKTWQSGNTGLPAKESHQCAYYEVTISNTSYNGRGTAKLTWNPLAEDEFLYRFRLRGDDEKSFKPTGSKEAEFKVEPIHLTPAGWAERAILDLVIGIPVNRYSADNPNVLFSLECDPCQIQLQTVRK